MNNDKQINARLKPFGLTTKDLTKEELARAKKGGGFFSSEELISKSFRMRNGK